MKKEVLEFVTQKTKALLESPTSCGEAKAAAQAWLDAVGTEREAAQTENYIKELQADIMPVDHLIGFAESEAGRQLFGADTAKNIAAHGREIRAAGAKYCDCPACAAAEAILDKIVSK